MKQQVKNKIVNEIVELSDNLLKFEPIFEYYDKYQSENQELFDVIVNTNEFQQLKNNEYYKQTTNDLRTNYQESFIQINESIKQLDKNKDNPESIKKIKKHLDKLRFSKRYLKQNIFNLKAVHYCLSKRSHHKKITKDDFLRVKKSLEKKLNRYISTYPL